MQRGRLWNDKQQRPLYRTGRSSFPTHGDRNGHISGRRYGKGERHADDRLSIGSFRKRIPKSGGAGHRGATTVLGSCDGYVTNFRDMECEWAWLCEWLVRNYQLRRAVHSSRDGSGRSSHHDYCHLCCRPNQVRIGLSGGAIRICGFGHRST